VWDSATGGNEIDPNIPLILITPPNPAYLLYYIQNDGNVAIRVTGDIVFPQGSATATWTPAIKYVDVPVGSTRLLINLTLTGFTLGPGSFTTTFTSTRP